MESPKKSGWGERRKEEAQDGMMGNAVYRAGRKSGRDEKEGIVGVRRTRKMSREKARRTGPVRKLDSQFREGNWL